MRRSSAARIEFPIVWASILVGVSAVAYGLWRAGLPQSMSAVQPNWEGGYLYFLAAAALAVGWGARALGIRRYAAAALLGVMVAFWADGIGPLLACTAYLLASLSLGHVVLGRLLRLNRPGALHETLVGVGLYGTLAGFSVHFAVNFAWFHGLALAVPMLLARARLNDLWKRLCAEAFQRHGNDEGLFDGSLLWGVALLYFAHAFLPELAHDPLAMHLFVPGYVAANHHWSFDPTLYSWTFMPMLADWSYVTAYLLGGETAVRLLNVALVFALALLVRELAILVGSDRKGANWAALITLSMPLTYLVGASVYVEAYWSAYMLLGVIWLFRALFESDHPRQCLLLAGGALGLAVAAKAVALVYLPALAVTVALCRKLKALRLFWWPLAGAAVGFLVLGVWPYVLAYLSTGNPVFPFFNGIFDSPYFDATNFNNSLFNAELAWNLPYLLVFSGEAFGVGPVGGAGFQWLSLSVAALAVTAAHAACGRWRAALALLAAVLAVFGVFYFQTFLRYVFPAFLMINAVIGLVVSASAERGRRLGQAMVAVAALTMALNLLFLGSASAKYQDVPVLDLFRSVGADELVIARAPVRKAVKLVNAVNENRFPVVFLAPPYAAGLESNALLSNWHNRTFARRIAGAETSEAFFDALRAYRAKYVIFDSKHGRHRERLEGFLALGGTLIGEFGSVEVYRLDNGLLYREERLKSPNSFIEPPWSIASGVRQQEAGPVFVSVGAPVTQSVDVEPGAFYMNELEARCAPKPGFGRLQVNWIDADGSAVGNDIKVFRCHARWSLSSQEIQAPEGARKAVVYGTGHGGTTVELARLSFRSTGS
ncbi:MAG: hypothetical protein OXF68_00570 [Gammaproteobacteria bacterium]|nr:hypothetical protein [Gammaproteobacteria bacterium]